MKHNKTLLLSLLILTILFNIIDIVVSIVIIYYGNVEEGNPVMATYLELGIVPFVLAKLVLVGGGCVLLWRYRSRIVARMGIYIVFSYYLALMIYFLYNATLLSEVAVWDY